MDKKALYNRIRGVSMKDDRGIVTNRLLEATKYDPYTLLIRDYGKTYAEIAELGKDGAAFELALQLYREFEPEAAMEMQYDKIAAESGVSKHALRLFAASMIESFHDYGMYESGISYLTPHYNPSLMKGVMETAAHLYDDLRLLMDRLDEPLGIYDLDGDAILYWCRQLHLVVLDLESAYDVLTHWLQDHQ